MNGGLCFPQVYHDWHGVWEHSGFLQRFQPLAPRVPNQILTYPETEPGTGVGSCCQKETEHSALPRSPATTLFAMNSSITSECN